MIHETTIDASLNRLMANFGSQVVFRPPATAGEIAELTDLAGPLPRDVLIFLSTCNGLRMEASIRSAPRRFLSVHEMLGAVRGEGGAALPPGLAPVVEVASSEWDCVVLGGGPLRDAVVRWDATAIGAELLASSFERYLDSWTRFAVEQTLASPTRQPPAYFGADFIQQRDPELAELRRRSGTADWLRSLDLAVACGDDFE